MKEALRAMLTTLGQIQKFNREYTDTTILLGLIEKFNRQKDLAVSQGASTREIRRILSEELNRSHARLFGHVTMAKWTKAKRMHKFYKEESPRDHTKAEWERLKSRATDMLKRYNKVPCVNISDLLYWADLIEGYAKMSSFYP